MKNWNNNMKIGAGFAAALALAGIGVIVWAVGFQGSSNKSGLKESSTAIAPIGTKSLAGAASVNASLSGPTMKLGGITFAGANVQATASLVGPLNQARTPMAKLSFNIAGANAAPQFESNGIGQFGANLVPLDSIVSAGDVNFANRTAAGQSLSASFGATANTIPSLDGGISLSSPSPVASVSSLVSPGELMLAQPAGRRRGTSLSASLGAVANTSIGEGGISFSAANIKPVSSIASAGSMMASQSYETSQPLSFNLAGANAATSLGGGIAMLNTSKVASVSSLVSAGSLLSSQSFETTQTLDAASATANSFKPLASLLNTRSTQSSSVATAGKVGILFCGALVNHKCTPQYTTSAPHTAKQLLVGFLWQGVPAGSKVQLFFIDVNKGQIIGKPSTAYPLPASSGGVILVGFKGPFQPFKLGVGIIINGKRLSGAAVINIV